MSLITDLLKSTNNEFASIVSEGNISDVTGFIDTGSYALNALISGSIYKGIPKNRIVAIAGEESAGKTFVALTTVKTFLDTNKTGIVFYFDSESAVTTQMCSERGMDTKRIAIMPVVTVEQCRNQIVAILNKYKESKDETPLFIVIDSLGMLSTEKEIADTAEGKNTRDMTRAQVIKSAFRVITINSSALNVPVMVTNHVYSVVGSMYPTKDQSGGSGLKYASSITVFMSKRKDKDGTDVVGSIIRCKLKKGRFTKEESEVELNLKFESGLDRYYGLLPIAEKYGIIEKDGKKYKLANGKSVWEKQINNNPETVFTPDILDKVDAACKKEFCFGSTSGVTEGEEKVNEDDKETAE